MTAAGLRTAETVVGHKHSDSTLEKLFRKQSHFSLTQFGKDCISQE